MAEAAFRHAASESGYAAAFARIDSCGTGAYHVGKRPDSRMSFFFFGGGVLCGVGGDGDGC